MAPEGIEWQRAFPTRALRALGWATAGGIAIVAVTWVLFGSEPVQLESGAANSLAHVPTITAIIVVVAASPLAAAVVRRPSLSANHFALTVRPGALRTLIVPWSHVAQLAAYAVDGEPFLLVRCDREADHLGDRPRWCDQGPLRAARRASGGSALAQFDLGLRLNDFLGSPHANFVALVECAPQHVSVGENLRGVAD